LVFGKLCEGFESREICLAGGDVFPKRALPVSSYSIYPFVGVPGGEGSLVFWWVQQGGRGGGTTRGGGGGDLVGGDPKS